MASTVQPGHEIAVAHRGRLQSAAAAAASLFVYRSRPLRPLTKNCERTAVCLRLVLLRHSLPYKRPVTAPVSSAPRFPHPGTGTHREGSPVSTVSDCHSMLHGQVIR